MTLPLDQANAIAMGAMTAARHENVGGMSVVVTDAGGHIRTAMRMESVGNFGIDIALARRRQRLGWAGLPRRSEKSLRLIPTLDEADSWGDSQKV